MVTLGGHSSSDRQGRRRDGVATTTSRKHNNARIIIVWLSLVAFGAFATLHYVFPYLWHNRTNPQFVEQIWNRTDAGLYRRRSSSAQSQSHTKNNHDSTANQLLLVHWMGGIVLMAAGPFQLLPHIRQHYRHWHRWVGRLYILAALLASGAGTLFTISYGTSRGDVHEDVGNILFGVTMLMCAVGTYYFIAVDKNVARHQRWATRLFATVVSAVFYRLVVASYFALVLYTPYQGSKAVYESTYYVFCGPVLLGLQVYWKWFAVKDNNNQQDSDDPPAAEEGKVEKNTNNHPPAGIVHEQTPLLLESSSSTTNDNNTSKSTATNPSLTTIQRVGTVLFCVGLVWWTVMAIVMTVLVWVPAMLGLETQQGAATAPGAVGT